MEISDKIIQAKGLSESAKNEINIIIKQIELKGVLTMQDFRHQLCQRLSGLFASLIFLLKVSTMELNSMLRNGEIKSEILPELFATYELNLS